MKEKIFIARGRAPGTGKGQTGTRDPRHDGIMRKIRRPAKVVIIEDSSADLLLLKRVLGKRLGTKIEIPADLKETTSLDDAKELIAIHSPDILITDKKFCPQDDAHFQALDFAKYNDPETVVILNSGTVVDYDSTRKGPHAFDHVVEKTGGLEGSEKIAAILERLLKEEKPDEEKKGQRKIKVVIIDDERTIINAVIRRLKALANVHVPEDLSPVENVDEARALVELHSPEIAILDKEIGGDEVHIEIAWLIKAKDPDSIVILHSGSVSESDYESKGILFDEIVKKPSVHIANIVEVFARERLEKEQAQKKAKLVILDNEQLIIRPIGRLLRKICDVPGDIPPVSNYEQAKKVITEHQPDIVLCELFANNMKDHLDILDFIKVNYPDTIVVLFTSYCPRVYRRSEYFEFDAFIRKDPDAGRIKEEVEMLVKEE